MPDPSSSSPSGRVAALAESFLARYRRGERPALAEYTDRYPELADEIRLVFPAMVEMERLGPLPGAGEPTGPFADGEPADGPAIRQIGDYLVLREIGRGGMGVVYEAEQASLGRHVALKVLPGHARLDAKLRERFRREARAAARLHHTNIVPVFGVGEHEGTPYYVMQFIRGQALDEVLGELRRLRRPGAGPEPGAEAVGPHPRPASGGEGGAASAAKVAQALLTGRFTVAPPLSSGPEWPGGASAPAAASATTLDGPAPEPAGEPPAPPPPADVAPTPASWPGKADTSTLSGSARNYWRGVARIGIQAAEALHYAHAQGTLHRDIKPSNILLDFQGTVWVTDFGLAKATDEANLTRTGDIIGTLRYMAPERFHGQSDPRSDVYGLGISLYELLTFEPAFAEADRERLIHQVTQSEPTRPSRLNPEVPRDLETICLKAIDREPTRRYPTAGELAADLQRYLEDRPIRARWASVAERAMRWCRRNPVVAGLTAAVATLLIAVAASATVAALQFGLAASKEERLKNEAQSRAEAETVAKVARQINWAHDQIPAIEAHIQAQRYDQAFDLLQRVAAILPEDQRLAGLRTECSWELTILTDPPGATVSRRPPDDSPESWERLGVTPIDNRRMALGLYHWKVEKPGYATAESLADDAFLRVVRSGTGGAFRVELDRAEVVPRDMVRVRPVPPVLRGFDSSVSIPPFWMDRFEVTNRQFKEFVDDHGYRRQEFWEYPFAKDGKALSWEEAMALFRDTTGQPGPATWALGSYPDGQDEFPVAGVSWYEAAAFARFAGKILPTVLHWAGASGRGALGGAIIPRSNLGRAGPAEVGQYRGLGPFGTYDMAGNVKEWCFNRAGDGKRYILGGAWDERDPMFWGDDTRAATDRGKNMGFRCVKDMPGQKPPKEAFAEVGRTYRDISAEKPLSDDAFQVVRGYYAYDKAKPLNAVVERREETASWVHERVAVDAAYGTERLIVHLFLPHEAAPPYQPVIYWPTAGATVVWDVVSPTDEYLAFLIKSGRALVCPVYKGTYERKVQPRGTAWQWDYFVQQAKDLSRTIDYLETRGDLNAGAVGYYGVSWGAADAVRALAVEGRIKAAVLADGGLRPYSFERPERDPVHYLPRITIPVLMLNGRYDSGFTLEELQKPMFRLLGTDPAHKRHSLSNGSHVAAPSPERIQETVSWFDLYLGQVRPKGSLAVTSD